MPHGMTALNKNYLNGNVMHPALRKEFDNLKALATEKNVSLALIESVREQVIFISADEKLVCLVLEEDEIHNMLHCFKVDVNKWKWAEDEGFELEKEIPEDLAGEILTKLQTPKEYLKYLGL